LIGGKVPGPKFQPHSDLLKALQSRGPQVKAFSKAEQIFPEKTSFRISELGSAQRLHANEAFNPVWQRFLCWGPSIQDNVPGIAAFHLEVPFRRALATWHRATGSPGFRVTPKEKSRYKNGEYSSTVKTAFEE